MRFWNEPNKKGFGVPVRASDPFLLAVDYGASKNSPHEISADDLPRAESLEVP